MQKADLKIGDRVSFLRSENKAVSLEGEIVKIHEGDMPCVDVKTENSVETAHVNDVKLLDAKKNAEGKSFITVNGKAI